MKLGILNAIHPETSKVNWQGTPVDAYSRFLEGVGGSFEFTGFNVAQGEFPDSVDACDAYLITGSPQGVYEDDPWILELIQFVQASYAAGKKLVGICFGHQMLAHALGGFAEKSEKGWGLGLKRFTVTTQKPWMTAVPGQYALYFAHQDQVVRLPEGAELLGGNDFCPVILFVIGDQVLGVQGHPEFTKEIMRGILAESEAAVSPEVLVPAADSLQAGVPDNALFGQWIVNFLTGESSIS
jgi:GMP synthase-like glutamine amidotransferase